MTEPAPSPDVARMQTYLLDLPTHVDEIRRECVDVVELASSQAAATPLWTCPDWNVGNILPHLTDAADWPTALIEQGRTDFHPPAGMNSAEWTTAVSGLSASATVDKAAIDRFTAAADRFLDQIAAVGMRHPVWTPMQWQESSYWLHWLHFELAVHRADLTVAADPDAPFLLDPLLAREHLDLFLCAAAMPATAPFFAPSREFLTGQDERLLLVGDEYPETTSFLIELTPSGFTTRRAEPNEAATTVIRATAGNLLLAVKGRRGPQSPHLQVHGHGELLSRWQRLVHA